MTPMVPFPQAGVPGPPHGSGMIPRGMPLPFAGPQGMQMGPMGAPHMGNPMIGPHTVTPQMAQVSDLLLVLYIAEFVTAAYAVPPNYAAIAQTSNWRRERGISCRRGRFAV